MQKGHESVSFCTQRCFAEIDVSFFGEGDLCRDSTDGLLSHWKYVVGADIVYREAHRGHSFGESHDGESLGTP
jgi:hypothetical protein